MCVWCPWMPAKASELHEVQLLIVAHEPACGFWKPNPDSLQEQQVPLATEPPFQPPASLISKPMFVRCVWCRISLYKPGWPQTKCVLPRPAFCDLTCYWLLKWDHRLRYMTYCEDLINVFFASVESLHSNISLNACYNTLIYVCVYIYVCVCVYTNNVYK